MSPGRGNKGRQDGLPTGVREVRVETGVGGDPQTMLWTLLGVLSVPLLVLANAFFVAAEFCARGGAPHARRRNGQCSAAAAPPR